MIDFVNESGIGAIGTVEDAERQVQKLVDQSGGFGCFLCFGGDIADFEATKRSYELIAQYVMPRFQHQLVAPQASYDWILGADHAFVKATINAIDKSAAEYASERGRPAPPKLAGD